MNPSVRSCLMAGIAAIGASVIAIAPSIAPPPDVAVSAHRPAATQVLSKPTVDLLAAVRQMTPGVGSSTLSTAAPAAVTAGPVPLNAASDFIINAWNAVLPWIDYGVDLTDYVLGFIPYGYLIGDQVSIVYYSLVRPVANSFVVDLVAPVVNAPLNLASYVNGLIAVGSVTVTSLINLGINEFNYFFGWLIPPIPPIPLAAETTTAELAASADVPATSTESGPAEEKHGVSADNARATVNETAEAKRQAAVHVDTEAAEAEEPAEPTTKKSDDEATTHRKPTTTSSSGAVQAQGEVRGSAADRSDEKRADAANTSPRDKKADADETKTAAEAGATRDNSSAKRADKDAGEK